MWNCGGTLGTVSSWQRDHLDKRQEPKRKAGTLGRLVSIRFSPAESTAEQYFGIVTSSRDAGPEIHCIAVVSIRVNGRPDCTSRSNERPSLRAKSPSWPSATDLHAPAASTTTD